MSVVNTEDQIEEIIIKQQPAEQIQAPTAVIQSEENKIDETVTTTTTVEEQQQPTFQASSSAIKSEQTIEEIIVQTQVNHRKRQKKDFLLFVFYRNPFRLNKLLK